MFSIYRPQLYMNLTKAPSPKTHLYLRYFSLGNMAGGELNPFDLLFLIKFPYFYHFSFSMRYSKSFFLYSLFSKPE